MTAEGPEPQRRVCRQARVRRPLPSTSVSAEAGTRTRGAVPGCRQPHPTWVRAGVSVGVGGRGRQVPGHEEAHPGEPARPAVRLLADREMPSAPSRTGGSACPGSVYPGPGTVPPVHAPAWPGTRAAVCVCASECPALSPGRSGPETWPGSAVVWVSPPPPPGRLL